MRLGTWRTLGVAANFREYVVSNGRHRGILRTGGLCVNSRKIVPAVVHPRQAHVKMHIRNRTLEPVSVNNGSVPRRPPYSQHTGPTRIKVCENRILYHGIAHHVSAIFGVIVPWLKIKRLLVAENFLKTLRHKIISN